MSREVIVALSDRARRIRQMAADGDQEGLKRSGYHKDKHVRKIVNKVRVTNRKAQVEEQSAIKAERKKELANRKHDIREILKYNKKVA